MSYTTHNTGSDALAKVQRMIRNLLIDNAMSRTGQSLNKQQTKGQLANFTPSTIMMDNYCLTTQYMLSGNIIAEINSGTSRSVHDFRQIAQRASIYARSFSLYPPMDEYLVLITRINEILRNSQAHNRPTSRDSADIGRLLLALFEYASEASQGYTDYQSYDNDAMANSVHEDGYDMSNQNPAYTALPKVAAINRQFEELANIIANPDTRPVLVKFIFSQSLGSSAIQYITDISLPLSANFFPAYTLRGLFERIWKRRFPGTTTLQLEPIIQQIDDSILQELEDIHLQAQIRNRYRMVRGTIFDFANSLIASEEPNIPEFTFESLAESIFDPAPLEYATPPQQSLPLVPEEPSTPARSTHSLPTPPDSPDDSAYNPDPLFDRLARDATEYVRALPDDDMTHDHMTRFSAADEYPRPISRDSLRDSDQRIVVRNRSGSFTHLVTFTRRSLKPIFNPVS